MPLFFYKNSAIARLINPLYDVTIKENFGSEQMKKNKISQSTKTRKKHSPNSNVNYSSRGAYNLDDYRDKKRNYYNPYGDMGYGQVEKGRQKSNKNPYRNQYNSSRSNSNRSTTLRYGSPYEEQYTKSSYTSHSSYTPPPPIYGQQDFQATPEQRKAEIRSKNKMTRKQLQAQAKRRKRRIIQKMTVTVIITMFITYAGLKAIDLFRYPSVSYQTVQMGMMDNSHILKGIIFRDEQVFNSTRSGDIHYILSEGEKVAKQGSVCLVAQSEEIQSLKDQLYTLDNDLYNKQEKRNDLSYYQADLYQINEELKKEMDNFIESKYWDNPKSVYELRQSLDKTIEDRTSLYIQDESQMTEGFQANREEILNSLKNNQSAQKATASGIVSYTLDGYESKLNDKVMEQLQYNQYKELLAETKKIESKLPSVVAQANAPLYKIITNDQWEIVTYMETEQANSYEVGTYYNLYFENARQDQIRFKLKSKQEEGETGLTKLVFASSDYLSDFLGYRLVEFSIGQNRAEGLKIPLKAIVEKNMLAIPNEYIVEEGREKGVLQKKNQANVFKPLNIQYSDEQFSYVMQQIDQLDAIGLNSVIEHPTTNKPYTISDMQTVQGVYVVNGQFAQFKRIGVAMTNKEYAILTQDQETKLKEFDQIISNPKNIREDQLLKYMNVQNE